MLKDEIIKFSVYGLSVWACVYVSIKVIGSLIMQILVFFSDSPDSVSSAGESTFPVLALYLVIPEFLIGAIGGWYLAEWIHEKIANR